MADQGMDLSGFVASKPQQTKPQSSWSNIGRGLSGAFTEAALTGTFSQPVRYFMQATDAGGYGKKLRQKFPGQTEDWYNQKLNSLYEEALYTTRAKAAKQVEDNPYPGSKIGNFIAAVPGSVGVTDFIMPGSGLALRGTAGQVAKQAGKYVAKNAALQGGLSGVEDVITQGLDMVAGMQDKIDPKRIGSNVALGATLGGAVAGVGAASRLPQVQQAIAKSSVPSPVKKILLDPEHLSPKEVVEFESQVGKKLTPEVQDKYREVLTTGTKEDIDNFHKEVGGPTLNDESIDKWLTMRDQFETPVSPKMDQVEAQIHRDTITEHVNNLTKDWKNRPGVNVISKVDDLPEDVRLSAKKQGITPQNSVGFFSHVDNKVHIFDQNITSPKAADAIMFHESLGHYGLAEKFGKDLDKLLDTLVTRNVGQFGKDVKTWKAENPKAYNGNTTRAAEEVLAEMSEKGPLKKSLNDAITSHIKRMARSMGMKNINYGDAEVRYILAMAHDAVINGKKDARSNRFRGIDRVNENENRTMYLGEQATQAPESTSPRWFEGVDGKPRFEISDNTADWDHRHFLNKDNVDLDEVLIHPELFKNYPELRQVKVKHLEDNNSWIQGGLDPEEGILWINPRAFDPKSTALHEVQHWIQYKEDFARGGNSEMFRLDNKDNLQTLLTYYDNELAIIQAGGLPRGRNFQAVRDVEESILDRIKRTEELLESSGDLKAIYKYLETTERKLSFGLEQIDEMMSRLDDLPAGSPEWNDLARKIDNAQKELNRVGGMAKKAADSLTKIRGRFSDLTYDMYNILTGEVEARDVQARMNMTKGEREVVPPGAIEGLLPEEQITYRQQDLMNLDQDPLGRETVPSELLDEVSQLKANPRFWSDPEYRANVIEYARARAGVGIDEPTSAIPEPSGFKSEAEARAALNRRMTPEQLQARLDDGSVAMEDLELQYENAWKDYVPTPRSDAEVRRAAVDAGISPAKVKKMKDTQDLSARIYRSQKAADTLTDKIQGLLEREGTPDWSLRDADNLRQALIDHAYILSKLWDDTAEVGRALRVARMGYTKSSMGAYKELLAEHGGSFAGLADDEMLNRLAKSLKVLMVNKSNPNGVNALVKGLTKPNWEEYLLSARTNMMLSGMSTHVTAVRDMIDGIGLNLVDHTVGLAPSALRELARAVGVPVKQGVHPAEVAARWSSILQSALDANTYINAMRTLREGTGGQTTGGRQYARIPIISKVGDLIASEDQFFRAFSTNMHLRGLGVRRAVEEARVSGKKISFTDLMEQGANYALYPDAKMLKRANDAQQLLSKINDTTSPQYKSLMEQVNDVKIRQDLLKEAQQAAETDLLLAPNILTTGIDAMRHKPKLTPGATPAQRAQNASWRVASFIANFMFPFVRTATNSIYERVIRRSPLTLIDPKTHGELLSGGAKADVAMGRIIYGTAMAMLVWEAAGKGLISGEGEENPNKRAIKMATGWRPKSVKEEHGYKINQNLGSSLIPGDLNNQTAGIIASVRESWDKGANEGQVLTGLKLGVYSIMRNLADNVWLGDIADDISTFTDPKQAWRRDQAIADQATSFMPNILGQISRVTDQDQPLTTHEDDLPQTIIDTAKSKIPGMRQDLPKRMTPFGEPVQGGQTFAGQSTLLPQDNRITGGAYIEHNEDPVVQEVNRLQDQFEESILTPVRRNIKIEGEPVKLNNKEFSEYQQKAGQRITENIREAMDSVEWTEWSDEEKAKWISKMQNKVKKEVREELYGGNDGEN